MTDHHVSIFCTSVERNRQNGDLACFDNERHLKAYFLGEVVPGYQWRARAAVGCLGPDAEEKIGSLFGVNGDTVRAGRTPEPGIGLPSQPDEEKGIIAQVRCAKHRRNENRDHEFLNSQEKLVLCQY